MELYPGYTNDLLNPYDIYSDCGTNIFLISYLFKFRTNKQNNCI